MKHFLVILFFLHLLSNSAYAQESKRAFFIGNSYTYYNTLPNLINNIANSKGDTLIHSSSTFGGAQLVQHATNSTTLNGIRQGNWDYVAIQEQSQKPSFPPSQVATNVLPYAAQLNDTIEKYNSCAETVFFMTWGRKNGDQGNCASYPPLCTYEGMQNRLRSSYLLMAEQNDAICSPVGATWKVARDSFPSINLYHPDESHPSYAGSYLAACTFYTTMFGKSPVGSNYYGSLSPSDAQALQSVAAMVVLDSSSNWYIGAYKPSADFNSTVLNGDSVLFDNTSSYTNNYTWDFGDSSNNSSLFSPSHSYDSPGTYQVTLIASDNCGHSDTSSQSIVISTVSSINLFEKKSTDVSIYPNPTSGTFTITSKENIISIRIFNAIGEEISHQKNMNLQKNVLYLNTYTNGVYHILIKTSNGQLISKKLVLQ